MTTHTAPAHAASCVCDHCRTDNQITDTRPVFAEPVEVSVCGACYGDRISGQPHDCTDTNQTGDGDGVVPPAPACEAGPHDGPHRIAWPLTYGGTGRRVFEAVETAMVHADADVADADLSTVKALIRRARSAAPTGPGTAADYMDANDDELRAAGRVLRSACEYMDANGYADDPDFPEDAAAAQFLGVHAAGALICWVRP